MLLGLTPFVSRNSLTLLGVGLALLRLFFFSLAFFTLLSALLLRRVIEPLPTAGRIREGAEDIEDSEGEYLKPVVGSNEEEVEEEEEEEEELLGLPNLQALHRRFLQAGKEHLDNFGRPRLFPLIYNGICCAINILKAVLKEVI